MAAMSDFLENKIIDWLLRGQAIGIAGASAGLGSGPTSLYIGLLTANPTDANTSGGLEIGTTTPNGYARVLVSSALGAWAGTQGAASTAASSGTSGTTSNNAAITFPPPAGGNWFNGAGPTASPITYFGIFDAATVGGGNLLFYGALTASKTVNLGDAAPSFAISALALQLDN